LKIINEFSRKLGKLHAASGLRSKRIASVSTPTGLGLEIDWALVRVTERQNLVSFTPRHTYLKISLEAAVALWQPVAINQIYAIAKHGRSSRWITGTLNAAKLCLRVKSDDTTLSFVFEIDPTVDTVIMHSLICHTTGGSTMDRRDSGSLILLNQPE
jgi:hypothetical protein